MRELVASHPYLQSIYDEHMEDNYGELLPHLLIADFCRWACASQVSSLDSVKSFLISLEHRFDAVGGGGSLVDNLIAVSFIEHLPLPGEAGADIARLLGPKMKAEYDQLFS